MAEHWWRAYDSSIDHPKLLKLSDAMHRAWYTLQCIASANEGTLPPAGDIALRLRIKPEKVGGWITQLVAGGLMDNEDGVFRPHKWDERQYKTDTKDPTAASRAKNYRDRKRDAKRDDRDATVTHERPDTEQIQKQSRAEPRAEISNSEKVLRTDLMEAFGPSRTPELSRAGVWLSKGYASAMIVEVVRELLARKPDIGNLAYFDSALAERHANQPLGPIERAKAEAEIDFDKAAALFKKGGPWSKYAGPEPGQTGCKCPPEILAKYGLEAPPLRRMDS